MSGFRWLAWTREGEAHAIPARGHVTRTACGQRVTDAPDRMSWPTRSQCPRCRIALGFIP